MRGAPRRQTGRPRPGMYPKPMPFSRQLKLALVLAVCAVAPFYGCNALRVCAMCVISAAARRPLSIAPFM